MMVSKNPTIRRQLRFQAGFLLLVFLATQTGWAQTSPTLKTELASEPSKTLLASMPPELGRLEEAYGRDSKPMIIHIQDAHANPEAQTRIKDILEWIQEQLARSGSYSLKIAVEGTSGALHPEYLNLVPGHAKANQGFVEDLVAKGELSGAELFAWEQFGRTGKNISIAGVEDAPFYLRNLANYRQLLFDQASIDASLQPLLSRVEIVKSKILNPALRDFLRDVPRKKEHLQEYAGKRLLKHAEKLLGIDLHDPIEQLRFPNLSRLIFIEKIHQGLDKEKTQKEWEVLKPLLSQAGADDAALERLSGIFKEQNKTRLFIRKDLEIIFSTETARKIDVGAYPAFVQWIGYALLAHEIDAAGLFNEISRLEQAIKTKLALSEKERVFLGLYDDLELLEKLLHLELTREEYILLKSKIVSVQPESLDLRLAELEKDGGAKSLSFFRPQIVKKAESQDRITGYYRKALDFYKQASLRDKILVNNALNYLQLDVPENKTPVLVLITGGFHSKGIISELSSKGFSYAVISPRVTQITGENLYHSVLKNENADLRGYFNSPVLNKQEAIFFKGLLENIIPYIRKNESVNEVELRSLIQAAINQHPVLSRRLHTQVPAAKPESALRLTLRNPSIEMPVSTKAVSEILLTGELYQGLQPAGEKIDYERGYDLNFTASGPGVSISAVEPQSGRIGNLAFEAGLLNPPVPVSLSPGIAVRSEVRNQTTEEQKEQEFWDEINPLFESFIASSTTESLRKAILNEIRGKTPKEFLEKLVGSMEERKASLSRGGLNGGSRHYHSNATIFIDDAIRYVKAQKIGIVGMEDAGLATAEILSKAGHFVSVIDKPEIIKNAKLPLGPNLKGSLETLSPDPEGYNFLVKNNNIIYLDAGVREGMHYLEYKENLFSISRLLGDALHRVRQTGDYSRKLFIIRAMVGVETSEKIYDIIKWHAREEDPSKLNFDVVYQPDFIDRENGEPRESHVVFGLREERLSPQELAQTKQMLNGIYDLDRFTGIRPDYMNIRSAEEAKDALLLFLATKLAHFNDLAQLSDRYGADLSVVAFGAGMDKRIKTLFANPSLGFGGRLTLLLDWIFEQRLARAINRRKTFASQDEKPIRQEVLRQIRWSIQRLRDGEDVFKILKDLPSDLHVLFWIENLLQINAKNKKDFFAKIEEDYRRRYMTSLRGKKVALLGVGYSRRSNQITQSPVLELIPWLMYRGVSEFVVADPSAREAFREYVKNNQDLHLARFEGVDGDKNISVYDAIRQSDLAIMLSDSNPEVLNLDLEKLTEALNGKPLFDGINLFGLRADGEMFYPIGKARNLGINLFSVGRQSIGSAFDFWAKYSLNDSHVYETLDLYPVKEFHRKNVAIIGGGYVGLVTGANLSSLGHNVHVVEHPSQKARIEGLLSPDTKVPIYEPGLRDMLVNSKQSGNITFSIDFDKAVRESEIVYLAVGTPQGDQGEIDLSYILGAASQIGDVIKSGGGFKTIVIKSTVTPDTFEKIESRLTDKGLNAGVDYALVSNPEFLREGQAIEDVTKPDRTVLGLYARMPESKRAEIEKQMLELWYPLMKNYPHAMLVTDTSSSTLIKYAANSFLAVSISFANLLAEDTVLSEADFFDVRKPLKADQRIGNFAFLNPGCGYGGSCFPKDVRALDYLSEAATGHSLYSIQIADKMNDHFKVALVDKTIAKLYGFPKARSPLQGKVVALWGIAFKPNTDDIREASSVSITNELLKKGVLQIRLDDPIFRIPEAPSKEAIQSHFVAELFKIQKHEGSFKGNLEDFKKNFKEQYIDTNRIIFVDKAEDSVFGVTAGQKESQADAILVVTEWPEYKSFDFSRINSEKRLVILDGRNLFYSKSKEIREKGIEYVGVGISDIFQRSEIRSQAQLPLPVSFEQTILTDLSINTEAFRVYVSGIPLSDVPFQKFVETAASWVRLNLSGRYFSPEALNQEDPVSWYQVQAELAADQGLPEVVLKAARQALGDFDWLLNSQTAPVHMIETVSEKSFQPQNYIGAIALGLLHQRDKVTLFVTGATAARAREIRQDLEMELKKLGLTANSEQLNVVALANEDQREVVRNIKQMADRNGEMTLGALDASLPFLKELGYINRMVRVHNTGQMESDTALVIAASLLRNQLTDQYEIINLQKWMREKGIDGDSLTQKIATMLQALQRISTAA